MQLNISLISNGFIVALQTPQKGNQVVFIPTKEEALAIVQEIINGIQQVPEPKQNTGDADNITPLRN